MQFNTQDDFLGSITLDLCKFPRGAKTAKQVITNIVCEKPLTCFMDMLVSVCLCYKYMNINIEIIVSVQPGNAQD